MRQIRDEFSAEIADMNYDELIQWLRDRPYSDPFLARLAEKAIRQADAAARRAAGR